MLKLFSLAALALVCLPSHATVRTVCNMPFSPGQYTTFQDALMVSASSGDTIYVHGSSINYGDVYIDREVVVVGTGHHPAKQNTLVSEFGVIQVAADNVQLIGIRFALLAADRQNGVVRRCRIGPSPYGNSAIQLYSAPANWLIEGNFFELWGGAITFSAYSASNCIIRNNIFASYNDSPVLRDINNPVGMKTYFLNNVLIGLASESVHNVTNVEIHNNIFYGTNPAGTSGTGCTANNNISYNCNDNGFYIAGANNLTGVDPQFTSYTLTVNVFDYVYDFRLQPTSPGHNTGTDGTDRGVFGSIGSKYLTTGEPPIAEVTAFQITSPTTVAPGGTLTISVTSKRVH